MENTGFDKRLPLESQLRLRQIQLQAEHLDADQLRECLEVAWAGWLLERHLVRRSLESVNVQIDFRIKGYTPAEVCGVEN